MSVGDGKHRTTVAFPDSVAYAEYSRTSSGWTIFNSLRAQPERRWRITHPIYGEKFFAEHDEILPWTLDQMRQQFYKGEKE